MSLCSLNFSSFWRRAFCWGCASVVNSILKLIHISHASWHGELCWQPDFECGKAVSKSEDAWSTAASCQQSYSVWFKPGTPALALSACTEILATPVKYVLSIYQLRWLHWEGEVFDDFSFVWNRLEKAQVAELKLMVDFCCRQDVQ